MGLELRTRGERDGWRCGGVTVSGEGSRGAESEEIGTVDDSDEVAIVGGGSEPVARALGFGGSSEGAGGGAIESFGALRFAGMAEPRTWAE